jgi:serine/threonine protein kinase
MMSDDSPNSNPKIVDLGFAKILEPFETTNEYVGSPGYTAPEVLM